MKKIYMTSIITFAIFGLLGIATARTPTRPFVYNVYLGTAETGKTDGNGTYVSGNTTVASGTSDLYLEDSGTDQRKDSKYILNTQDIDGENWAFEISAVTPNIQYQSDGNKSGTTYTVNARCYNDSDNSSVGQVFSIVYDQIISSSNTPYPVNFTLPYSRYKEFELVSGTPIDGFNATLIGNIPGVSHNDSTVVVSSMIFTSNGPLSGTSNPITGDDNGYTLPDYAHYGKLRVISTSGNSLFLTVDGKTFNRSNAETLQDEEGYNLNRNNLEKVQFGSAADPVKWRIDLYSREP